jgi:hypothetical protein
MALFIPFSIFAKASEFKRDLSFLENLSLNKTHIAKKRYKDIEDKVFHDSLNREVYFSGWNINNAIKVTGLSGRRPYENVQDAREDLWNLKRMVGSNVLRFLLTWEKIHPKVDTLNAKYLDDIIEQIKVATQLNYYILIDYHQDVFSRFVMVDPMTDPADGAPKWIVEGMAYALPKGGCLGCKVGGHSVHNVLNPKVTKSYQMLWFNEKIQTPKGDRGLQDEWMWQFEESLKYIFSKLNKAQRAFIIGIEPINEPQIGRRPFGLSKKKWNKNYFWPFYLKTRKILDSLNLRDIPIFAEPVSRWNINAAIPGVTLGEWKVPNPPQTGFVFSYHFYDAKRMFPLTLKRAQNGVYLNNFNIYRRQARRLGWPLFMTEFGHTTNLPEKRRKIDDPTRIIMGMFQGIETEKTGNRKTRLKNFYSHPIPSTYWAWDWPVGGVESPIVERTWNYKLGVRPTLFERVYPRKVQGDILNVHYNTVVADNYKGELLKWSGLKLDGFKKTLFTDHKFFLLVWRGRNSEAPTEIFLPRHFDLSRTVLMTKNVLTVLKKLPDTPIGKGNEIFIQNKIKGGGQQIFIYDDPDQGENSDSYHFAFIVELNKLKSLKSFEKIRKGLLKSLNQEKSPIIFQGPFKSDRAHYKLRKAFGKRGMR